MVAIPENNINDVHITWEQLKKIPDYKEVAGEVCTIPQGERIYSTS